MDFPGEFASWSAERSASGPHLEWRVSQQDRFGWDELLFGVAGRGPDRPLMAVANFADGAQPYAARLVLRDVSVTQGPFLDWRQSDLTGHLPIDARPAAAAQTHSQLCGRGARARPGLTWAPADDDQRLGGPLSGRRPGRAGQP